MKMMFDEKKTNKDDLSGKDNPVFSSNNKSETGLGQKAKALSSDKKTFRLAFMFVVPILGLMLIRAISSLLPLSDNVSSWFFSFIVQVVFMGIVPVVMYRFMISPKINDFIIDFRINVKIPPVAYVMAIFIGLSVSILNTGTSVIWATILKGVGYQYANGVGTLYRTPEILIMEIITTCMFPAIFEEITDRGLFLAVFNKESDKFKIIFVGLCFGVLHQNVPQLVPAAVGGIIITYMAVKSGSIIPGMIVHFVINFTIVIGEYAEQTGGWLGNAIGAFQNAIYNNILTLMMVFIASIFLTQYLLKQFRLVNLKSREKIDGPAPEGRTIAIQGPKPSLIKDILEVYGPEAVSDEDKRAFAMELVSAMEVAKANFIKDKTKKGVSAVNQLAMKYMPAYIALIAAGVFTILTFIFRFRP